MVLCEFCKVRRATESITETDTNRSVLICLKCESEMEWDYDLSPEDSNSQETSVARNEHQARAGVCRRAETSAGAPLVNQEGERLKLELSGKVPKSSAEVEHCLTRLPPGQAGKGNVRPLQSDSDMSDACESSNSQTQEAK
jgi:hypothetical protein